jgi:hypothetical protein
VIEGGGWVLVGEERIRVAAGEAIVWPPDVDHGAWTDYSEMRAFVVEFAGSGPGFPLVVSGEAVPVGPGESLAEPGIGALAPHPVPDQRIDRSTGEPA